MCWCVGPVSCHGGLPLLGGSQVGVCLDGPCAVADLGLVRLRTVQHGAHHGGPAHVDTAQVCMAKIGIGQFRAHPPCTRQLRPRKVGLVQDAAGKIGALQARARLLLDAHRLWTLPEQ